ncbi:MAG TPA: CHAD domain-containing protein [Gemmatimonadales bacterium]|nr:CHAD domain-containing protein [Gemmatimonadales bacterium]
MNQRLTHGQPLTVAQAAGEVVTEQVRALRTHARVACRGRDVEAVHQLRVATRRLRAAFRVFGAHAPAPRKVLKGLRRLARELGPVRDHDVILALLASHDVKAVTGEERAAFQHLVATLDRRRARAQARLVKTLTRPRFSKLLARLRRYAASPGGEDAPASTALVEAVTALGEVVARHPAMAIPAPSPAALHDLRIAFKRLRYALDFHAAACGLAYDVERRMAHQLQDVLGAIHDHDLLLDWIGEARGPFRGPWQVLRLRLSRERQKLFRRFLRQRAAWLERTQPAAAPIEEPRFVNLEPAPVALRLVTRPRHVASTMIAQGE